MSDYERVEQAFQHILKKYAQSLSWQMARDLRDWMDVEGIKGNVGIETSLSADLKWEMP